MQSESDTDSNSCMARQTCSLRLLVKAFESQQWILIQSFFGCYEFQALLQRNAALKIELDGNDLGTATLILALALKCWTKKAYRTKKARHVMSLIIYVHQSESDYARSKSHWSTPQWSCWRKAYRAYRLDWLPLSIASCMTFERCDLM